MKGWLPAPDVELSPRQGRCLPPLEAQGPGPRAPVRTTLSGWGGWPRIQSEMARPGDLGQLLELMGASRGAIARGLGRSYGDAAQVSDGLVVDMRSLGGIDLDPVAGVVTAGGGTSFAEILSVIIPRGWFLPVTPGTKHVTVGGAIAADVHGKNHHRDGSLASHLEWLELVTADGGIRMVYPGDEAFVATVGGMGLTGMITRASLRLIPIETSSMAIETTLAADLDAIMEGLVGADRRHRYTVAWIDFSRPWGHRGVVLSADHARIDEIPARMRSRPLDWRYGRSVTLPRLGGKGAVNSATVRVFNRLWLGRAQSDLRIRSLNSFFYPLDAVAGWNRLYGDKGFLQYQFVVPPGQTEALVEVARRLSSSDIPVALAVLKRMGAFPGGLLSFPIEGWTLAVDMPLGDPGLDRVLVQCDSVVAAAGGRVYLAKDSRMGADSMTQMYPALARWRQMRARLDPAQTMRSDLSDRLELVT